MTGQTKLKLLLFFALERRHFANITQKWVVPRNFQKQVKVQGAFIEFVRLTVSKPASGCLRMAIGTSFIPINLRHRFCFSIGPSRLPDLVLCDLFFQR